MSRFNVVLESLNDSGVDSSVNSEEDLDSFCSSLLGPTNDRKKQKTVRRSSRPLSVHVGGLNRRCVRR